MTRKTAKRNAFKQGMTLKAYLRGEGPSPVALVRAQVHAVRRDKQRTARLGRKVMLMAVLLGA